MLKRSCYRNLAALLCALVLTGQIGGIFVSASERSALDAFNSLVESGKLSSGENGISGALSILDGIMTGSFGAFSAGAEQSQDMAGMLPALLSISDADLARCASERDLFTAQVRNAYYKGLAAALRARISAEPAEDDDTGQVQTILALFLKTGDQADPESEAQKDSLREKMTEGNCLQLADSYGLPASFVCFIIMDRAWDDDDWQNDEDWRRTCGWYTSQEEGFGAYNIGSRDTGGTAIRRMQEKLSGLGYLSGKADGIFGPRTQAALLEFQLANGMRPTGICTVYESLRLEGGDAVARWEYDDEFWDPDDDEFNNVWGPGQVFADAAAAPGVGQVYDHGAAGSYSYGQNDDDWDDDGDDWDDDDNWDDDGDDWDDDGDDWDDDGDDWDDDGDDWDDD